MAPSKEFTRMGAGGWKVQAISVCLFFKGNSFVCFKFRVLIGRVLFLLRTGTLESTIHWNKRTCRMITFEEARFFKNSSFSTSLKFIFLFCPCFDYWHGNNVNCALCTDRFQWWAWRTPGHTMVPNQNHKKVTFGHTCAKRTRFLHQRVPNS